MLLRDGLNAIRIMGGRPKVKKTSAIFFMIIFWATAVALCLADEKKDHICFRTLDADKDGMVTLQEFEKYYENEKEKFSEADLNKDGTLSHEEYHHILGGGSS
jgi:Ca2+-binding EF-hand superfamily protein